MTDAGLEGDEAAENPIGALYDFVVADMTNTYHFVAYRLVDADEAARTARETGLSVAGFMHIVDTSAVRHIIKRHSGPQETLRGQVPITRDDLLRLPEIVGAPDRIENGERTRQGRDTVRYYKQIEEDEVVYVAEVRTKWSRLAALTLRRSRAGKKKAASPTPDAPS